MTRYLNRTPAAGHETSLVSRVSETPVAKAEIVKDASVYTMAVIPAGFHVEMNQVRKVLRQTVS